MMRLLLGLLLLMFGPLAQAGVIGYVDAVNVVGTGAEIKGWACSTGVAASINVHVYVGGPAGSGTYVAQALANQASTAPISAQCQTSGTTYRYTVTLSAAARSLHANKLIYVHGISPNGGGNLLLTKSGVFSVPAATSATRTYTYNSYQELCRSMEPETGATLMGYDGVGNVAWSASGLPSTTACDPTGTSAAVVARKASRTYDARNRVKTLKFPDGRGNVDYTYAPDGLPTRLFTYNTAGATTVANDYAYNKRRLLTSETLITPAANWPFSYIYNANGHLSAQSWHGLNIDYAPNALGQPTKAGTFASGVSYYPNGAIKQFTYGNGIVHTMTQNARQLPSRSTDCTLAGACAVTNRRLDLGYTFDKNANVSAITDYTAGARQTRAMSYDGLDRLTQTTSSPSVFGTVTYGYNVLDNLTAVNITGGSSSRNQSYVYDAANRLSNIKLVSTGATVVGLSYDPQGNLQNKNGVLYGFDYGNRMRTAGTSTYLYDGLGRRVTDTVNGVAKHSQYIQGGQLVMTGDSRANTVNEYVYLGGSLVATRERNVTTNVYTTKYQHTDALGTPIALTDSTGAVIEKNEYEPYGQQINRAPLPPKDVPGYTGHVQDAATGLTYMQQRYYDPMIGRFLSVDPVTAGSGAGANFNRYWYANNNPYRFKDPDGRKCATADGKESCTFDEFKDKKGGVVTRDAALGGKVSQLFGRGSRILRAERAMTAKYSGAKALAAKNGSVTIKGSSSLGIADKTISGAAIASSMESIVTIANEGPAPNDTATLRHDGGVPSTLDGSPSPGPMRFWSDGANGKAGTLFGHEILHTIYSGVSETNRGWANPDYNLQHQVPFDDAANDF